ncbi:YafY family transcriptional regulator [Nocardia terpenica]|uniref:helix-turn-helix transcriptional regulator n=1 Tax=Nocardia terpenica TaxID=455432 RepID=UPI0018963D3D|nr:YafY family protein [Nocardia terpenica]MBF6059164.1 YafY family transcriptional regulator [Nocardia terpenica]MBF6103297.1 YafY family transcriptional regulator [Nocardia terpenica]MBF6110514.1 YafY family transcriptional regulator [Nocardia terpenica]MBF6116645.1 YafY family transcriptional regulator [Nocardia terpenica]
MMDPSARLLRLLSLLQTPRDWPGTELADRLGVSTRTVRRDIDRLRELGYPVHATQGTAGYRLGAGSAVPPLLLDDEEALAVAVGLRTVAGGTIAGIEEASLRSLAKLEQVLPSRLRHRLTALQRALVRVAGQAPRVDPDTLIALSDACHRHERIRFDYTDHGGRQSIRDTEPHAVVNFSRHWYLVAWDVTRNDWRSFRIDRLHPRTPTGPRFTPRDLPGGDVVTHLSQRLSTEAWSWRATVTLHRPAHDLTDRIWPGMGILEPVDDTSCLLHLGADSPWSLTWMISSLDTDFTVTGPPELIEAVRTLGRRCTAAVTP